MAEESKVKLIGNSTDYRPPVLAKMQEFPHTLCSYCPLSRWYKRRSWECFCIEYKSLMYDEVSNKVEPVVACDARELELIRLKAE
jgi:hypothetical protein